MLKCIIYTIFKQKRGEKKNSILFFTLTWL